MPQDLPPAGGYEPIQYKRNLPSRGFRPSYYLFAMGVIMTYGWWKVGKGIRERKYGFLSAKQIPGCEEPSQGAIADWYWWTSEMAREKMWGRIYLIPLLQAEEDRDLVRKTLADKAREQELLGSETSPYNSDRFVRPTFAISPSGVSK